jgi:membrane fusion protein, multidrug efflux system
MTNPTHGAPSKAPEGGRKKIWIRAVLGLAVLLAAYFGWEHYLYESTDDAYIEAHTLMLAPRIGGTVEKVLVEENDQVKAGQVLAELDDRDYAAAYSQAQADQASVQADLVQARQDYDRKTRLFREKAISRSEYDAAMARFKNLSSRLQADQFKSDQAKLNLDYTRITAPEDGFIAKKSVEPGMVVPAGQALFGLVGSRERWVTANFKETQLSRIRTGQKVEVSVDALGGKQYPGVVDSIGSATGSTFTLLPPDNSTGNFTKVVQRVPVKIDLPGLKPEDIARLAAGLSAEVSVRVH